LRLVQWPSTLLDLVIKTYNMHQRKKTVLFNGCHHFLILWVWMRGGWSSLLYCTIQQIWRFSEIKKHNFVRGCRTISKVLLTFISKKPFYFQLYQLYYIFYLQLMMFFIWIIIYKVIVSKNSERKKTCHKT
jgi:hypothetical protein